MGNIFCSPLGGLCNKIRHIVCGKILAESLGYNFYITDWIDNDYMPGFDTVFNINNTYNVRETDVDIDFYVNMDTTPIYDLNELKKYNNIFLPGFSIIKILDMPEEEWNIKFTEYLKLIDPVKSIKGKIPKLNENTIGIHIRRGDNEISIKNSPIEKFLETLTLHSDRNIFLTTDDKEVETLLVAKYPNIITNKKTGFHNNKTIIRADIRTLSMKSMI